MESAGCSCFIGRGGLGRSSSLTRAVVVAAACVSLDGTLLVAVKDSIGVLPAFRRISMLMTSLQRWTCQNFLELGVFC